MAKYQTRRSISISGPLYARVLAHARSQGRTMSGLLEEIFTTHLAPPQDPPTVTPNDVDRMTLAVAYREQAKHAPLSLVPCVVCGGSRVYTKRVRRRVRRDRHAVRQRRTLS